MNYAPNEPKSNAKSIRLSDSTLAIIEGIPGTGFNKKLENLAWSYRWEEEEHKKRVAELEAEERKLRNRIKALITMENTLANLKTYLDGARRIADSNPIKGND